MRERTQIGSTIQIEGGMALDRRGDMNDTAQEAMTADITRAEKMALGKMIEVEIMIGTSKGGID